MSLKDEVSQILYLYDKDVDYDTIKYGLKIKLIVDGRIGFNSKKVEDSNYFKYLINSKNADKKLGQQSFYKKVLEQDLDSIVEKGLLVAKSVMPSQDYFEPEIVLLLDSPGTDARVISHDEAGINLTALGYETFFRKNKEESGVSFALKKIASMAIHEGNHLYLRQVNYPKSKNWIKDVLFSEGLATYLETEHLERHNEYLGELGFWIKNVKDSISAESISDKFEVIKSMSLSAVLKKYNSKAVNEMKSVKLESFSEDTFQELLNQALVKNNGPIYHVGYQVWKTIAKEFGAEKIKDFILKGPDNLVKAYLELSP